MNSAAGVAAGVVPMPRMVSRLPLTEGAADMPHTKGVAGPHTIMVGT